MKRLLPCFTIITFLVCMTGSVAVPYLPQPSGDAYIPLGGVCSAPPSLLPALCGQYPVLDQIPAFIQRSKKIVDAGLPDISPLFPARPGEGSFIDSIIVKTVPRFL